MKMTARVLPFFKWGKIYRGIIIENILENEKKYYEMNDFYDDVNKILEFIRKQNRLNAIIINT